MNTSSRTLFALLILAPVMSTAVQQFWHGITVGLLDPLGHLIGPLPQVRLGPFSLNPIVSGLVGSSLTIAVGTLLTLFVLKLSWRFIDRALSDADR